MLLCAVKRTNIQLLSALRFTLTATVVTLLGDGELDTSSLGHGDPRLASVADDEDVGETGGEVTSKSILNVDDVETTRVTFTTDNDTSTALVTTTGNHDVAAGVHMNELEKLVVLDIVTNSVVDADQRVGVSDRATVVGDDLRNTLVAQLNLLDLQQLVLSLLGGDAVDDEATLGVVQDTEVLTALLDGDDVHESGRVGRLSANLSVDLDETLHCDRGDLTSGQSVLQTVTEQYDERQRLAQLVGTRGRARGVGAGQLVQQP